MTVDERLDKIDREVAMLHACIFDSFLPLVVELQTGRRDLCRRSDPKECKHEFPIALWCFYTYVICWCPMCGAIREGQKEGDSTWNLPGSVEAAALIAKTYKMGPTYKPGTPKETPA